MLITTDGFRYDPSSPVLLIRTPQSRLTVGTIEREGGAGLPRDGVRDRSPNLDQARIEAIVRLIRRMSGKPSWDAVVSAAKDRFGCRYTRQALFAHPPIRLAYQERKSGAAVRPGERPQSDRSRAAAHAKTRLLAELTEVKRREELLLERIATWMYNAHANGIPLALLDAKLGGSRAEAAGTAPPPGPATRSRSRG